jgi:3-phosphoshikimate 1-carboxyvinyltransferase
VALDLHDSPDLFPVACILAAKAKGTSRIRCSHLRFKESDRITAMYRLLVGIGVEARELEDGVEIFGRGHIPGGEIPAINDHRVIMAGAIAGIPSEKGTTIQNADAVRKSYPGFFDDLKALNVSMEGEG